MRQECVTPLALVVGGISRRCFALGWIVRIRDSRALKISAKGEQGFGDVFGVTLNAAETSPLRKAG